MKKYTIRRIIAVLILIVVFAATLLGLKKLVEIQDAYNCPDEIVTIEVGDTHWSIATANCTGSIQAVVDHLVNEYGFIIEVGQKIQLP